MADTPSTQNSPQAREIIVPRDTRTLGTLSQIDYENAVLVEIDSVGDTAHHWAGEHWARAILEDPPVDTRRKLTQAWTRLGLQLGPVRSDRHVLGWPIRRSTGDHALLGASTANGLHAELLIQRRPHVLVFASFIGYDTSDARRLWAEMEHMHTPVMRQLLQDAVARAAPA